MPFIFAANAKRGQLVRRTVERSNVETRGYGDFATVADVLIWIGEQLG